LSKNNRTLLVFTPNALTEDDDAGAYPGNPISYNFTIIRDSDNSTIISNAFQPQNVNLQVELIQTDPSNQSGSGGSPTVTADSGGFKIIGDVFSEPGNYTLVTEIQSIGASPPPEPMRDEFQMSVLSNNTQG
jgi:hypothetical protein